MLVDEWKSRERPKKRQIYCVKADMKEEGVKHKMTDDKAKTQAAYCADPK